MPRTRYTKKDDPDRYQEMLEEKNMQEPDVPDEEKYLEGEWYEAKTRVELLKMDPLSRREWITPQNNGSRPQKDLDEEKRRRLIDYIGSGLTNEQFEGFESSLSFKQENAELLDQLVKFVLVVELTEKLDKNDLVVAFCGDMLGKTQEEINEARDKVNNFIKTNSLEKHFRENQANKWKADMLNEENRQVFSAESTLRNAIYDGAASKDPASKEKQEEYTRAAAKLFYYNNEVKEGKADQFATAFPKIEESGYHLYTHIDKIMERKQAVEDKIDALAADPSFKAFVQEQRAANVRDNMTAENFKNKWPAYVQQLNAARNSYQDELKGYEEHPEAKRMDGFLLMEEKAPEDMIDDEAYRTPSKEDIRNACRRLNNNNKHTGLNLKQSDFLSAANLIVTDTLINSASDKTFFATESLKYGNGNNYDVHKVNEAFIAMRDQVIKDPIFEELMTRRISGDKIVSAYKAAVKAAVNEKIASQNSIDKALKKDENAKNKQLYNYMKIDATVEQADFDMIRDTYEKIKKYNEGKKPSDEMKRLTAALEKVTKSAKPEKENGDVKVNAIHLDELNKATLGYYSARQGRVFSPFTDAGKARLGAVEKLAFTTDRLMNGVKAKAEAMQKQQAKGMGV